jgi:hypothetical protein
MTFVLITFKFNYGNLKSWERHDVFLASSLHSRGLLLSRSNFSSFELQRRVALLGSHAIQAPLAEDVMWCCLPANQVLCESASLTLSTLARKALVFALRWEGKKGVAATLYWIGNLLQKSFFLFASCFSTRGIINMELEFHVASSQ